MNYVVRVWRRYGPGRFVLVLPESDGWNRRRIAQAHIEAVKRLGPFTIRGKPRTTPRARLAMSEQYQQVYE